MTETKNRRDLLKFGTAAGAAALALGACKDASSVASAAGNAVAGESFVIPAPDVTTIPVAGTNKSFAVRRIYCLGRNYDAHAYESGDDPTQTPPFYFQKPTDAIVSPPTDYNYPPQSEMLGYEAEMYVALKSGGRNISAANAAQHIYGYGIALDMTLRDLQAVSKEMRRPWEPSKSFDHSAPCSPMHRIEETGELKKGRIWLSINDEMRQDADMSLMRWNVNKAIEILSQRYELKAGDVILTGTPEGVGIVKRGDVIKAGVDGVDTLEMKIV